VIEMLSKQADLQNDQFIILAGQDYNKPLEPNIKNVDDRLKGLGMVKRIRFLKNQAGCIP